LILFLPLIGLGIYALRCLLKAEWTFLKPFLAPQKTIKQVSPRTS